MKYIQMTSKSIFSVRSKIYGVLALLILLHHTRSFYSIDYSFGVHEISFLNSIILYAQIACESFLFLSGLSLIKSWEKCPHLSRFYFKRALRILLPVYISYGLLWIIQYLVLTLQIKVFILKMTGLAQLFLGNNDGSWFISCILLCYLIFPAIYRFICPDGTYSRLRGLIVYLAVFIILFIIKKANVVWYEQQFILLSRMPAFILGAIFGCELRDRGSISITSKQIIILCAVIVISICIDGIYGFTPAVSLFSAFLHSIAGGSVVILLSLIFQKHNETRWKNAGQILSFMGSLSLELYCWQLILIISCEAFFGGHVLNLVQFTLLGFVALFLSYFSHQVSTVITNVIMDNLFSTQSV